MGSGGWRCQACQPGNGEGKDRTRAHGKVYRNLARGGPVVQSARGLPFYPPFALLQSSRKRVSPAILLYLTVGFGVRAPLL